MKQRERDGHVIGHTEEYDYALLMVNGWLYGNAGKRFSIEELEIELCISSYFIQLVLKHPDLCGLFVYDPIGTYKNYLNTAPCPLPTKEGLKELLALSNDALSNQAREEFYCRQHDPNIRRRRKSIAVSQRY